jgi:hypothetical protein
MMYYLVVITGAVTLARWLMGIIEYLDAPVRH